MAALLFFLSYLQLFRWDLVSFHVAPQERLVLMVSNVFAQITLGLIPFS